MYTVEEAMEVMKIGKTRIYQYMNAGLLPFLRSGGRRIRRQAIIEFFEKYEGWDLSDPEHPVKMKGA